MYQNLEHFQFHANFPAIVANYNQYMYDPLSSGHRCMRKEYFVHNWSKALSEIDL